MSAAQTKWLHGAPQPLGGPQTNSECKLSFGFRSRLKLSILITISFSNLCTVVVHCCSLAENCLIKATQSKKYCNKVY